MPDATDDVRRRDLECDRLFSAGLCVSATAIAATRMAVKIPAAAGLFAPHGVTPLITPFVAGGFVAFAVFGLMIGADQARRPFTAIAVAVSAALVTAAVPIVRLGMTSLANGASPPRAAAVVAFVTFGIVASMAIRRTKASHRHAFFSAALTIFALFQAVIDPQGIFACILAVMGFVFFSLRRHPDERTP